MTEEIQDEDLLTFIKEVNEVQDFAPIIKQIYDKLHELMFLLTKVKKSKANKLRRFLSELSLSGFN